jgi:hypothetical protein
VPLPQQWVAVWNWLRGVTFALGQRQREEQIVIRITQLIEEEET